MIVNGVTLPDIPAEVLAEKPNAVVTHAVIYGTDVYSLAVSSQPFDHGSAELLGQEMLLTHGEGQNYMLSNGVWDDLGTTSHSPFGVQLGEVTVEGMTMEYTLVWTNQTEFKEIVWIDSDTMEWGTEPKEEKPTRVSIGRSLVDGYAKEVQRLTGTTEQMNAIQIREKLSTVKAAIKIGDTVLPPIPEDVLAQYPYVFFQYVTMTSGEETMTVYSGLCSSSKFAVIPPGMIIYDETEYADEECYNSIWTKKEGVRISCFEGDADWEIEEIPTDEFGAWTVDHTSDLSSVGMGTMTAKIVWSNHDICVVTEMDYENGIASTVGTEVYFSERQNFNGVWLPPIPDGFFAEKPKGLLYKRYDQDDPNYYLTAFSGEGFFVSSEVLAPMGVPIEGEGAILYDQPDTTYWCRDGDLNKWYEGNPGEGMVPIGNMFNSRYEFLWANFDIHEVTEFDPTTGAHTLGGLYYPPLPAIDTDRVSIGYDLCDGIVEEVQRLSGESEKMNALRAYWKLTTVDVL